jgi:hypothetical protein
MKKQKTKKKASKKTTKLPPFPIQPFIEDSRGVVRFRQNAIVRYLLDEGGLDLNHLVMIDFPQEDFEQFAQLQRGAFHQHAFLAGDHTDQPRVFLRRIRPERAENRHRQVVHHDVALRVGRHFALMRNKGVAVLEDGDFLDGQLAERA